MNKFLACVSVLLGLSAFAEPAITLDRVQQRYPWNGIVDVDYTVSGAEDPTALVPELFAVSETGRKIRAATFLSEPDMSDGSHRLSWNATADGADYLSKDTQFRLSLRFVDRATDGDYMIIDLSKGPDAPAYKVSFMSDVADPAATFNTDEYKTTKIVFKKIKAGSFWMGASDEDLPYVSNNNAQVSWKPEFPRHYVTLTKDFFIGIFKLTNAQYLHVTNDVGATGAATAAILSLKWNDVFSPGGFMEQLGSKMKCLSRPLGNITFPTEAQWEYACRAGTTTPWFFGNDPSVIRQYAVCMNEQTLTVGTKLPNPWGLYDMYGLANEIQMDYLSASYPEGDELHPVIDPYVSTPQPGQGNAHHTARGGASWDDEKKCRSAYRNYCMESTKTTLRLCLTVEPDARPAE